MRKTSTRVLFGLPLTVVLGFSGLGVMAIFFPGRLPSTLTADPPVSAGVVKLLVGAILVGAGGVYLRQADSPAEDTSSLLSGETPPEVPKTPPRLVGESFETAVEEALRDVRLKDVAYNKTDPHKQLHETAQRALVLTRGYDRSEAIRQLDTGAWTTDPVAKAFLSERVAYPVWFRLLRWAKPGYAYQQAIDRTSQAIDASLQQSEPEPEPILESFAEFRANVERYLTTEPADETKTPTERDTRRSEETLEADT